ncbi:hypothetical protein C8J57DRAFT_1256370 [Mycena rebaudengoi]|nr:hypothetical protein C8J57DRAFT_1256370 [Mycena rebaudengoi]
MKVSETSRVLVGRGRDEHLLRVEEVVLVGCAGVVFGGGVIARTDGAARRGMTKAMHMRPQPNDARDTWAYAGGKAGSGTATERGHAQMVPAAWRADGGGRELDGGPAGAERLDEGQRRVVCRGGAADADAVGDVGGDLSTKTPPENSEWDTIGLWTPKLVGWPFMGGVMELTSEKAHTAGRKNDDSIRHLVQACFSVVNGWDMPRVYCGRGARRGAGHEIHVPGATGSLKMGSRLWLDCVSGLRTYLCQMANATSRGNGLRGSLAMLWNYFARRLRRAATPSTPKFDFCSPRDRAISPPLSRSFAAPPSSLPSTNLTSLHAAAGDINSTLYSFCMKAKLILLSVSFFFLAFILADSVFYFILCGINITLSVYAVVHVFELERKLI